MSTNDVHLSIKAHTLTEVPSEEALLKAGKDLIYSLSQWKKGKAYDKGKVQSYSRPKGPNDLAPWFARSSVHDKEECTFEEFWKGLGTDKGTNEAEYVHELKRAKILKQISHRLTLWSLYYTMPPPVSARVFNELQLIVREDTSEDGSREFVVVSLPIDVKSDPELAGAAEKGVCGRYTSVELVKELPDGKIRWDVAVSSAAGGWVPGWLTNMNVTSGICQDVPRYIKWIHKTRNAATTPESTTAPS